MLEDLFEEFVKERKYLQNVATKTVQLYHQTWKAFHSAFPTLPEANDLNKEILRDFVVKMRESGLAPVSCNMYIRAMNAFLNWMLEQGHIKGRLKIGFLKVEKKVPQTLTDGQLRHIVEFKPSTSYEVRDHALVCLLIDTGIRIDEALSLESHNVDLENLQITVRGKGAKHRVVPISSEVRRKLWQYKKSHHHDLFFCTKAGKKLTLNNCRRGFRNILEKTGLEGIGPSFHQLRHTFALNYVRQGGGVFHLQKAMGHSSLSTTLGYVGLVMQDLKDTHERISILNRLKRQKGEAY